MKWNISRCILIPLISTSLGLCRVFFFREQSLCSVSSSTNTTWTWNSSAGGMAVNPFKICAQPLFINLTSDKSCNSGQWWPNSLLIKILNSFTGVPILRYLYIRDGKLNRNRNLKVIKAIFSSKPKSKKLESIKMTKPKLILKSHSKSWKKNLN